MIRRVIRKSLAELATLLAVAGGAGSALAAAKTWVGNTDANWGTAANWSASAFASGDSQTYNAGGTAGTNLNNNLAAGTVVAGIAFSATASPYTLGGNSVNLGGNVTTASGSGAQIINLPLVLTGNRTATAVTGAPLTFGGAISDGGGGYSFYNAGGSVTLGGNNTFTGDSGFAASGTRYLYVSSDANLGLGSNIRVYQNNQLHVMAGFTTSKNLILGGGAQVTQGIYANSGTFTINGVISDANAITGNAWWRSAGSGTLVLGNANNTFGEQTFITAGTLSVGAIKNVGAASSLGQPATAAQGTISIGSGATSATLQYTGAGDTSDRVINLNGTTGGATLDQSGAGLLKFTSALTATGSGAKTLTLLGSTAGSGELAGAIIDSAGGATSVAKSGTGAWTLSGANTYSGNTTLNTGGLLNLASASALGTGTFTIGGNGSFDNTSGGPLTLANAFTLSGGSPTFVGTASLTIGGTVTLSGANRTITVNGSTLALSGNVGESGARSLTKAGAGALTLAGANTYSGGTSLNAGQLNINSSGALGSGALTISSGTVIDNTGGGAVTLNNNAQTWSGVSGTGFTFAGSNALHLGTGAVTLSNNRKVTVSASSLTVGGVISGNYYLLKDGAGTLVLSGANAYTGKTYVRGGTLLLGASEVIPAQLYLDASAADQGNATVDLNGKTETVSLLQLGADAGTATAGFAYQIVDSAGGGLLKLGGDVNYVAVRTAGFTNGTATVSAAVDLNGATRTFTVSRGTNTYDLVVSGNVSGGAADGVLKTGTGNLVLSGTNNTFGGDLGWVSSDDGDIYAASLGNGGGRILFSQNNALHTTASIATTKGITFTGGGSANQDIYVDAGTLTIGGLVTCSTPSTFNSGFFNFRKYGTGTLALTNDANTFNTRLQVNNGTLSVTSVKNVGEAGALGQADTAQMGVISLGYTANTVGLTYTGAGDTSDRVLNLSGTTGSVTIDQSGSGLLKFTSALTATGNGVKTLTLQGAGDGELAGAIVNSNNKTHVTKSGSGTWTLSGANTYSGTTTVNAGTLRLGAGGALTATNAVVLSGGALDAGAFDNTAASLTVTADSTLAVTAATRLTFASQTAAAWDGTLTVTGTLGPASVRFWPAAPTADQLAHIRVPDGRKLYVSPDGYLRIGFRGTLIGTF